MLYLVGSVLVSAADPAHAQELAGMSVAPLPIPDDIPHGVIGYLSVPEGEEEESAHEVEITDMSDRGVRRFKNLDTGAVRTERR